MDKISREMPCATTHKTRDSFVLDFVSRKNITGILTFDRTRDYPTSNIRTCSSSRLDKQAPAPCRPRNETCYSTAGCISENLAPGNLPNGAPIVVKLGA